MPKNGEDWCKLIVAKGFKKLPKVQNIAQSGHTARELNRTSTNADFAQKLSPQLIFFKRAIPGLFFLIFVFSIHVQNNFFADDWIRTALPTEPQSLPTIDILLNLMYLYFSVQELRQTILPGPRHEEAPAAQGLRMTLRPPFCCILRLEP